MTGYVIMASRGCYSDNTEYPVRYGVSESLVRAHMEAMQQRSAEERQRWCDAGDYNYGEWDAMRARIGDEQWSPNDDTRYWIVPLEEILP